MQLPPGLVALVRLLPRLLFTPATVYITLRILKALTGKPVPGWLRVLAYLLALPAMVAAKFLYTRIRDRREAARRGAILPPSIKYRWPGALDKLSVLLWNFSNGYLGMLLSMCPRHGCIDLESLAEYVQSECEEIGNTFDLYAMYESRASASSFLVAQRRATN
ncbi:hypothetical protein JVT61DRAFT_3342 [Boletus reticuloceps]|uniref:Uncharacterized protein n=1 Tax=Boletus reticuloceps TaxID=495285 RepID=A0A8I3A7S8_9AGAM|nr:hypothetical protein JVT61DRAFT_3626 [Boletus reticuloceps]KAG6375137.1 hypothetical protein JVT61DRAFT_3342 [Boletus reticuloceps]